MPNRQTRSSNQKILQRLGRDLAINHVKLSLGNEDAGKEKCLKALLKKRKNHDLRATRTIVVVGAGASHSAYPGVFPLGGKAIEHIERYFGKKKDNDGSDWMDAMLQRAEQVETRINLPKLTKSDDFETRLFSLSHFFPPSEVRRAIQLIYGHRTMPNLFYEIVAHLLKNRFVDGVINFNFDELLDQAVEEEVGMGQLHKILSDGDCVPYADLLLNNRLRVPFYIKPHGTVSHKSSLRFTKEDYLNLPSDLEGLMEEIFSGEPLDPDDRNPQLEPQFRKLHLIVAGFAMESIEFNRMLHRAIQKLTDRGLKVEITLLKRSRNDRAKKECERIETTLQPEGKRNRKLLTVQIASLGEFQVPNDRRTGLEQYFAQRELDRFALCLLDEIRTHFLPEYVPGDVFRHLGLLAFFQKDIERADTYHYNGFRYRKRKKFRNEKKEFFFQSEQYYLERTLFEIIYVVLKNGGTIQPKESLKKINRVGVYFNRYIEAHRKRVSDGRQNFSPQELSIYDLMDLLHLESSTATKERHRDDKELFHCGLLYHDHVDDFNTLLKKWIEQLDRKKRSAKRGGKRKKSLREAERVCRDCLERFKRCFAKISTGDGPTAGTFLIESDPNHLYPDYQDFQLNIISQLDSDNIIPSELALRYRYRSRFLQTDSWTHLHLVSDRAQVTLDVLEEMVKKNLSFPEPRRIHLVLSDDRLVEEIENRVASIHNLHLSWVILPYYDHNRHLALFTGPLAEDCGAVYYYKKGYSNNINAVYLRGETNPLNLDMLFHQFRKYLAKGIFFQKKSKKTRTRSVPDFRSDAEIAKTINGANKELLKKKDKKHFARYRSPRPMKRKR